MTNNKRKLRLFTIKAFALLSIVRWLNILLTIFAQYLAALFVLTPGKTKWDVMANPKLHCLTLASAFIIAAGYIINSFYDLEKDLINRPEKTLFGRVVSRKNCLNSYFLFNTLGLGIAFLASYRIFIYYLVFAIALWAYSHKFQKISLVREIMASLLSVASFFSIGIFYHFITWPLFMYGCFAMLIIFTREILKGIEAYKGNAIFGYGTVATWLGIRKSTAIILVCNAVSIIPLLSLFNWTGLQPLAAIMIGLTILLNTIIYLKLYRNPESTNSSMVHNLYKVYLVIIICLVVLIPANTL